MTEKTTTLELLDEVNCKFTNLDPVTRKKMYNKLSFMVPYARYLPGYMTGQWDGRVSMCSIGGATQINLIERILPIITEAGYDIEINDKRAIHDLSYEKIDKDYWKTKTWPKGHRFEGQPIELREDQAEAINIFLENQQSISELATGFGKSMVIATLSHIVEKDGRSLIIVPSKVLVNQMAVDYNNLGMDVGVYFGDKKQTDNKHLICTWQSLDRITKSDKDSGTNLMEKITKDLKCIIVDECHLADSKTLVKLLTRHFQHIPIRWGLTGTVPKEEYEYLSLYGSIGPVVNTIKAHVLQEQGSLAKCNINIVQMIDTVQFDDFQEEQTYLSNNEERIKWVADFCHSLSKTGNTLLLVGRIETGNIIKQYYPQVEFIHGTIKTKDRDSIFESFKTNDNMFNIGTYGTMSTGVSINRIFNLVLFEGGKSFTKIIQSIGRSLRMADDKEYADIYDLCSTTKYSKLHLGKRVAFYKDAKYPYQKQKIQWK